MITKRQGSGTIEQILARIGTVRKDRLVAALPLIAMTAPMIGLYLSFPSSFELTWKGRAYYLFFLWLTLMEILLEPRQPRTRNPLAQARKALLIMFMILPTVYVAAEISLPLNRMIMDSTETLGIYLSGWMPLSIEYLAMTIFFVIQVVLLYGVKGLSFYSVSTSFIGLVAMIYNIDNIYPYGRFAPFQIFVPATANLASMMLNLMGYNATLLGTDLENMPQLLAQKGSKSVVFSIAWPCSGVESLIIYTTTIMLFLKKSTMSMKSRVVCFLLGAVITYLVNVLRIATIFIIAINQGMDAAVLFHVSYGQLYSLLWITFYMLVITMIRYLSNRRTGTQLMRLGRIFR